MDSELAALCVVATRNALYLKMDQVMAAHKTILGSIRNHENYTDAILYDVHAFGDTVEFEKLNLYVTWPAKTQWFGPDYRPSNGCDTWTECFEHLDATEIWLENVKVFEKRNGDWVYVEGQKI